MKITNPAVNLGGFALHLDSEV